MANAVPFPHMPGRGTPPYPYAIYRGRHYRLRWMGYTGKGEAATLRAKLAFLDGSKDFWVHGGNIELAMTLPVPEKRPAPPARTVDDYVCDNCQRYVRVGQFSICRDTGQPHI